MQSGDTAFEYYRRGDFQRAEEEARNALSAADDPALRHLLGILLCRRGLLEEGIEELRRANSLAPKHPGILFALVRVLIDNGRGREALGLARRPKAGPAAEQLWRLRAAAAGAAGELAERLEALHEADLALIRTALEREPERLDFKLQLARLESALARDEEAEPIYREILAAEPANPDTARELGLLLERSQRVNEAKAVVESAISAGADRKQLALIEAYLAWRDGDPKLCLHLLEKAGFDREPVRARQLQAKALDALGDTEGAYAAAEAQNRAVAGYAEWRQRAVQYRKMLRVRAEMTTPEWAGRWTPVADLGGKTPVFLVGFPRSGTTLLDTFLMGHPDITVAEEVPALGLAAERLGSFDRLVTLSEAETKELRSLYLDAIGQSLPSGFGGTMVDKLPLNMVDAALIHRLFPNAKIILALRHPCDCVLSAFFQNFALNPAMACFLDIEDAADLYDAVLHLWSRSAASLPLRVHTSCYESLVEHPEKELRGIVDFLDLDWDESMIDHRSTARARGAISTPSYDQVIQPLTNATTGRWKRYEKQLEPVLPVLLPWAERLGYET